MSTTEASEEIKAIRVLPLSGLQQDWDEWSEKYQGIAAERGYLQVMLGKEDVPMDALNIDQQVKSKYLIQEAERKQKHLARKRNQKGYQDLQLLTSKLPSNLFLSQRWRRFQMDLWPKPGHPSRMRTIHQKEKMKLSS